ncbi:MAG: 50S ribosomal protein L23 [bacterium]|nr:50S ribosomal protein L23 [bacterium]
MDTFAVIKKPKITEKSLERAASGWYTFIVDKKATKFQIKTAIETSFSVKVLEVRTTSVKGKTRRVGRKRLEKTMPSQKKAMVFLAKGQKIDLFETGGTDEPKKA